VPRAFVMHLCNRILKIQLQPGIVVVGARRRRWWWLVPNSTDGPRLPGFLLWLHFNLLAIKCTFIIGTMPAKGETPEWLLSVRIRICICISTSLCRPFPLTFPPPSCDSIYWIFPLFLACRSVITVRDKTPQLKSRQVLIVAVLQLLHNADRLVL